MDLVRSDIEIVVKAAGDALVKVILETCYLSELEKVLGCRLAEEAGAHFVNTSTGFGTGGATLEDVELLRTNLPPDMGVKASGGIRDREKAHTFLKAGAARIGTSAGLLFFKNL